MPNVSSNADSVCRYCGEPIAIQESGEWGHKDNWPGVLRFWCLLPGMGGVAARVSPNGSSEAEC